MSDHDKTKRLPDGGTVSPPPPPPPPPPATDVETTQPLEHVVVMPKPPFR